MPEIVSEDDSLPGLIDDSDSDDDSDFTTRHVRRRLPWQSRVDPTNRFFQGVYVAGRTSAARIVDDNISGLSVFGSLQQLGAKATATQSKRVEDMEDNLSQRYSCHSLSVILATDVSGLRGIGGMTKNPERGIALVFHKDDTDKFYKLHASKVVEYIRKVYSIGVQDVHCESRVYNTLDQQQRA